MDGIRMKEMEANVKISIFKINKTIQAWDGSTYNKACRLTKWTF